MSISALFQPFSLKSLQLSNRIAMAPMTRYFSPGGIPGNNVAQYYRRRAEGGVGLIFSEGTGVDRPRSVYDSNIPRFHGEQSLAGWQRVIDKVHQAGGKMAPQLWHVGAVRDKTRSCDFEAELESPSGLAAPGKAVGVTMSEADIAATIAAFAQAAVDAKRLGFDCIEIHGAHGYLIDQFFWRETNLRTDDYGGDSLAARSRFAVDVVKAIRAAVGEEFVISLRLSQWKQQDFQTKLAETPEAMAAWLEPLADAGVDLFHCSQRRFWEPEFARSDLNFAGWAKKLTGKATITVGSVGLDIDFISGMKTGGSKSADIRNLVKRLDNNEFDLVAVGRVLLTDPNWPTKVRAGEAVQGFDGTDLLKLT